jgi:hypothetical protein
MVVHLIPVRRSAHDIFTGSYALLVLTPVAAPPHAGTFHMTAARRSLSTLSRG